MQHVCLLLQRSICNSLEDLLPEGDDVCMREPLQGSKEGVVVQMCDCKAEDFYCEYGYEKKGSNSQCTDMAVRLSP
jgi:hypothetical protein